MVISEAQSLNAYQSIDFTLSGISIVVILEQPSNAYFPIFVTVSGILIYGMFVLPEYLTIYSPISVTPHGIIKTLLSIS